MRRSVRSASRGRRTNACRRRVISARLNLGRHAVLQLSGSRAERRREARPNNPVTFSPWPSRSPIPGRRGHRVRSASGDQTRPLKCQRPSPGSARRPRPLPGPEASARARAQRTGSRPMRSTRTRAAAGSGGTEPWASATRRAASRAFSASNSCTSPAALTALGASPAFCRARSGPGSDPAATRRPRRDHVQLAVANSRSRRPAGSGGPSGHRRDRRQQGLVVGTRPRLARRPQGGGAPRVRRGSQRSAWRRSSPRRCRRSGTASSPRPWAEFRRAPRVLLRCRCRGCSDRRRTPVPVRRQSSQRLLAGAGATRLLRGGAASAAFARPRLCACRCLTDLLWPAGSRSGRSKRWATGRWRAPGAGLGAGPPRPGGRPGAGRGPRPAVPSARRLDHRRQPGGQHPCALSPSGSPQWLESQRRLRRAWERTRRRRRRDRTGSPRRISPRRSFPAAAGPGRNSAPGTNPDRSGRAAEKRTRCCASAHQIPARQRSQAWAEPRRALCVPHQHDRPAETTLAREAHFHLDHSLARPPARRPCGPADVDLAPSRSCAGPRHAPRGSSASPTVRCP